MVISDFKLGGPHFFEVLHVREFRAQCASGTIPSWFSSAAAHMSSSAGSLGQLLQDVEALEQPLLQLGLHGVTLHAVQPLDGLLQVGLVLALVLLNEGLLLVRA